MTLPRFVGHRFKPLRILAINQLPKDFKKKKKWKIFFKKGFNCYLCNKQGVYLIESVDRKNMIHIDLYTSDFMMITMDHCHPASRGGGSGIKNLFPCCHKCNKDKGILTIEEFAIKTKNMKRGIDYTLLPDYPYDIGGEG